ncbi:DUF421 domain-containing protein [Amedibacterium intestinale]|uniref:UPF0702 transmembrane protein YrbG n=1 Tax=Amedibacterium intestinale TaxID=2583452 RepID=A0A6N4TF00_9FIRM|nr:DUF421 domain-containing protein [Amedibacterium intestinale]RHO21691.1 DUF421 domain-containing protein [Eubacterium sp. AM18-26]RHO25997.1 DUF421 domain-containing protein [Eubacterium sp. AM18-10LB-B]RHO34166.1 DUF421 domain-containing protein [Erysipelotrichaceae bacterium AM17-60]BBK21498.1 UPF0702 transmembrane protein YrbG [Amedibacterium intestinale]BBK61594.1 UPF0702 transmembrane protein YrbG [Amedibacterium intestinale]
MAAYITLIFKCFLFYMVIIIALRIMGKREVGELSVFDIVIYLVMSELLALSISNPKESVFKSLVPIFTLAFLQIIISVILLKSKKLRDIFDGKAVIIIHDGQINQKTMKKERYSIDDLMSQIRDKDLCSPEEVAFAILENNGNLSVLPKKTCKVRHPDPLISDGKINKEALIEIEKDEEWLKKELQKEGVNGIEEVFLCLWQKSGMYVIKREFKNSSS